MKRTKRPLGTPTPTRHWGRPGRCPACSAPGYLDRVDLIERIQEEHCPDCGHKWVTREQDLTPVVHD
jgi:DNA-directed RNA polymerase subunit RPC12/RpoP